MIPPFLIKSFRSSRNHLYVGALPDPNVSMIRAFKSFGIYNSLNKIPVDPREKLQDGHIIVKFLMNFKLPVSPEDNGSG